MKFKKVIDNLIDCKFDVGLEEYKYAIFCLIFLKYLNDISSNSEKHLYEFWNFEDGNFIVPKFSKWQYLIDNVDDDIALKIDVAFEHIIKENPYFKDFLSFSRLNLDNLNWEWVLNEIDGLNFDNSCNGGIGQIYDYFLSKLAIFEGWNVKHYSPNSVVRLLVNLVEPYDGNIYDPCCGYGTTFAESLKFIEKSEANKENVFFYGQEENEMAYNIAKINLASRGIDCDLGEMPAGTFHNDLHKDLKADYILAIPPFNQKNWRRKDELLDDLRWSEYITPPISRANYAWLLHIVSKLDNNGVGGVVIANGSSNSRGVEYIIRRMLIENDLVEIIVSLPRRLFYSSEGSAYLWILNKNKSKEGKEFCYRNRSGEVLFLDLRQFGEFQGKHVELSDGEINRISHIVRSWRCGESYSDNLEFSYSANKNEISLQDYSLLTSDYVGYSNKDEKTDFDDSFEDLKVALYDLITKEKESTEEFLRIIGEGYEFKI